MKMKLFFILLLAFAACDAPEDVSPAGRNTFIKFFGNSIPNQGRSIEFISNGYAIVSTNDNDTIESADLLITDELGNTLLANNYANTAAFDLKAVEDGYLILGDSIIPVSEEESISALYLFKTDLEGNIQSSVTVGDQTDEELDYHGEAMTVTPSGEIVVVGTRENNEDLDEIILVGLDRDLNILWEQFYNLSNRSLNVSKSIFSSTTGAIIFASTASTFSDDDNDLTDSYISIPVVRSNSENINNDSYGQNTVENYTASDILLDNRGIAITGSTNINGNQDIVFFRGNSQGFIQENSVLVISESIDGIPFSGNDNGISVTNTSDGGYVIMGAVATTPQIGNGGLDIYLLKLDATGNKIWENFIGGNGDEIGTEIRETSDGGFVIIGTQVLQGASMGMLVKTNNNGQLIE